MDDADATERATPPTKRLKGFVAASQKTTAPVNKPVSFVPVEGRPGYFKLVDLPDLFPVLPASAATLLRDVTVEEAVSLFHKFVGKNLTEDSQSMLGLPGQGVCPLPGTLDHLRGGRRHLQPAHCGGQADLEAGWGKPGCRWPRWYPGTGRPQPGGRHGPGKSSSENGHGRGDHHGRRGPA